MKCDRTTLAHLSSLSVIGMLAIALSCTHEPAPPTIDLRTDLSVFLFSDSVAIDTSRIHGRMPSEGCIFYESPPTVVFKVAPQFPESLVRLAKREKIWVKAYVDTTGAVIYSYVLKSDNIALNRAALRAMVQWRFTPPMDKGKKLADWVITPFFYHKGTEETNRHSRPPGSN
jgi:TonB family protein